MDFLNVVLPPFLFQLCLMVVRLEKRKIRSNPESSGLNDLAPRSMGGKGESGAAEEKGLPPGSRNKDPIQSTAPIRSAAPI